MVNTFVVPQAGSPVLPTTITVGITTLKEYTLECYHQGFYPEVGDLAVFALSVDAQEGAPITVTGPEMVTLLRAYRKAYRNMVTLSRSAPGWVSPWGMTPNGSIHDPIWDTLLARHPFGSHNRFGVPYWF